uniref:Ig-like domain-containing protein n=1 Tax=Myripristis murdjan TaxID=586833 RepID=A0A667ZPD0_9TELE
MEQSLYPVEFLHFGIHLKFELTETGIFLKICVVNFSVLGLFFHRPLALNLKAQPGENVTLSCQAPDGVDIEWSRTDLEELQYVFLYRDGHIDSDYQHQSFKNRVELKDKEMKNGNLSVILKNVKEEDSGTYECRFKAAGEGRRKRAFIKTKPISTIQLEVADPDPGELSGCRLNLNSLTGFYFMLEADPEQTLCVD